jgi:arabinogalactan oligomer/maltooligosaccharide transport system substrate-binding protein
MKLRKRGMSVAVAIATAAGAFVAAPSHAATTVLVWADETRGPNLQKTLAAKSDWVSGVTIKVQTFSSFDALNAAFENSTAASGPDIIVGANDWIPKAAKSGKVAPITLTASQKARFNGTMFYDLSYKGKLYGIPLDINNVAMIYNTKLVTSAPKSFGEMVDYYQANKSAKSLKAGLCIAGGGMSWGALSVFSALGADPYYFNPDGKINKAKTFNPSTFGSNVKKYLVDSTTGKGNGFFPASDTGCKENFLAGKVPFAVIGNWEWKDYVEKGFDMNLMPVPGVASGDYGHMFGSVSGAILTSYANTHGVAAAAKSVLTDFFGSTAGAVAYQKYELRPPAEKGAQSDASVTAAQKGFGSAASLSGIPQIGAALNTNKGGANYWDSAPAFWSAVLTTGKDPVTEAKKLSKIWSANLRSVAADL